MHFATPPVVPALPPDNIYRDLCVGTLPIDIGNFDATSGDVNVQDKRLRFWLTGGVAGAKPVTNTCIPMKNTPLNPLTGYESDPNYAYAWFLHTNNAVPVDKNVPPNDFRALGGIYKNNNDSTLKAYMMVGGAYYCNALLRQNFKPVGDSSDVEKYAAFHRSEAENCYDQYITERITNPWFTFEPAGSPLAQYLPNAYPDAMPGAAPGATPAAAPGATPESIPGGTPNDKATRDLLGLYCQPLMAGDQSQEVYANDAPYNEAGYAKVISSNNPLINENEYNFSWAAGQAWQTTLITGTVPTSNFSGISYYTMAKLVSPIPLPAPFPFINLPCLEEKLQSNLPYNVYPVALPPPSQPPEQPPPNQPPPEPSKPPPSPSQHEPSAPPPEPGTGGSGCGGGGEALL